MTPPLTREQVRRLDALACAELHIPSIVLMENAGANAARILWERFGGAAPLRCAIFCGTGNNGGDGLVIARHLHNAGAGVRIAVCGAIDRLSPDAAINQRIVAAMALPIEAADQVQRLVELTGDLTPDDVIVDALLGTGFQGAVRSPTAELIGALNRAPRRALVAIDVPSGLDCDSGVPADATIRADLTITFAAEKIGFKRPSARPFVGEVVVAGIGTPPELIARVLEHRSE